MHIRWTPTAAEDLQSIYDYLKEHEPHLAPPHRDGNTQICSLPEKVSAPWPYRTGGRHPRTATPTLAAYYRVPRESDAVEILHIWHPARDR
jgi:plasmid stabilization system protein ParE